MQRELRAIQTPIPAGGMGSLTKEIELLRDDCKRMAQEVEETGPTFGKI